MELDALKSHLKTGVLKVTFKKANGDLRTMSCTTNLERIPPSAWPKGTTTAIESHEQSRAIRVYDTVAQSWRSFIYENVIEVKEG